MLELLTNPGGILASFIGLLVTIGGVWLHGRRKGKQVVKAAVQKERIEAMATADKVEDAVASRPAESNRDRLKGWGPTVPCILALIVLAGCQTPSGSYCDIARPLRFSGAVVDAMTDAEVNAVLAQNETGAKLCGWQP